MITGVVSPDGEPIVMLPVAGQSWRAVVDTGFNGDLELPDSLQPLVNARFQGTVNSLLAGGQTLLEDVYLVDFPFDGGKVVAEATFVPTGEILLGTHLLRRYHLAVDFFAQTVLLDRVA